MADTGSRKGWLKNASVSKQKSTETEHTCYSWMDLSQSHFSKRIQGHTNSHTGTSEPRAEWSLTKVHAVLLVPLQQAQQQVCQWRRRLSWDTARRGSNQTVHAGRGSYYNTANMHWAPSIISLRVMALTNAVIILLSLHCVGRSK